MTVHEKLIEIQQSLKVPKNQNNSFGNYKYRSCEDILEAVKKILPEDIALLISDEVVQVGNRNYVKATACLMDSKSKIEVHGWACEAESKKGMDTSQVTGSASSYARKYALNGLFCIDDTKDADATNTHGKSNGKINPVDKTGNKEIDRAAMDEAMNSIQNCVDAESATEVGRYQYKKLRDMGATDEQLGIIQDQVANHKQFITKGATA